MHLISAAGASPSLVLQLVVSGVVLGSFYALLGMSVSVIYSTTKVFHFAHAFVYTAAAYVALGTASVLGLPIVLAIVIGLIAAVVLGVTIELVVYRSMRRSGASSLGIFLASLGISIAGPNLIQIIFGPDGRNLPVGNPTLYTVGTVTFTTWDIVTVVVSWVLIGGVLAMRRSRWGLASIAVSANRELSAAVGISPQKIYVYAFAVGSLLIGSAAILFTLNQAATPNMGLQPVLFGFIATFLAGVGNQKTAPLAGFVLGMVVSLSGIWLSQTFQTAVIFGLLFVALIVRPQGIFRKAAV
ncbi:branched-chain amino acid ABC transporter permease [Herbiconiux sp.]|uniref:branched-chain amino acid ABC transporter permease n=1 Tax=Herbiconiux sp. TaxID=1871186 RepID=UPI0025C49A9E|nr:branched-chain amino acid ABC transporter permease [Herbiconiux sp.]